MKKGIEVWADYDENNRWCLRVQKARGRFTLDELTEIAKEYEQDIYAVIIKALDADLEQYYDDVDMGGDYVTLYRVTDFLTYKKEKPPTAQSQ